MSRLLRDLDQAFYPRACELLAKAVEARLNIMIIETSRTMAQHEENVKNGFSWAAHSKHLDGLAIDVGIIELLSLPNRAPDHPLWNKLGAIGESVGCRWGGRWKQRDCVHFEQK
jgi:hypothetical protein